MLNYVTSKCKRMKPRVSLWTTYVLFFATCIPQGHTRSRQIDVDGVIEAGINITKLLKHIASSPNVKLHIDQDELETEDWEKKLKEAILKYMSGIKIVPDTENEKNMVRLPRSDFWSAAETLINNLAAALASNPDEQVIVQPSKDSEQYSLLQDIQSGRIRGPVHVYGRHAGKSDVSSDEH